MRGSLVVAAGAMLLASLGCKDSTAPESLVYGLVAAEPSKDLYVETFGESTYLHSLDVTLGGRGDFTQVTTYLYTHADGSSSISVDTLAWKYAIKEATLVITRNVPDVSGKLADTVPWYPNTNKFTFPRRWQIRPYLMVKELRLTMGRYGKPL